MDRHAYHNYQILEHVEQKQRVTNRVMARKLDVSVKLAHELLGKLVRKGLLHVRKQHARRWDYFLTPQGMAEKARLTYQFLDFSMQFYREARRRSAEALSTLSKSGARTVAFLGATELAEIATLGAQEWGLEILDVFDGERAGLPFLGRTVRPLSEVGACKADGILVTAFDPAEPMARHYLPPGAEQDTRLVWIFDAAEAQPSAADRTVAEQARE